MARIHHLILEFIPLVLPLDLPIRLLRFKSILKLWIWGSGFRADSHVKGRGTALESFPLSLFSFLLTFFIHRFLPFLANLGLCPDLASFEDGFGGAFAEQPRTTYHSSLKDFFNLGCRLF
jgi:hypothetical protein